MPYVSSYFDVPDARIVTPVPLKNYYDNLLLPISMDTMAHILLIERLSLFSSCISFTSAKYILLESTSWDTNLDIKKPPARIFRGFNVKIIGDVKYITPLKFKGKILLKGYFIFHPKPTILTINVRETHGLNIVFADQKFHIKETQEIKIKLDSYLGKNIFVSFESPEWSSIEFSLKLKVPTLMNTLPTNFIPVWSEGAFTIYENTFAAPIARFPSSISFVDSFDNLTVPKICTKIIYLPSTAKNLFPVHSCERKVLSFRYVGFNKVEIKLKNSCPSWLFIGINQDGNWKAKLDGENVPVFKAQKTFMAVPVLKKGTHTLLLLYSPLSFKLGLLFSTVMILAFLLGNALVKKR